jgi:hypothetical protein
VTANGDFGPYLVDDIGNASDGGSEMAPDSTNWLNEAFGSESSSILNDHMSEWPSPFSIRSITTCPDDMEVIWPLAPPRPA